MDLCWESLDLDKMQAKEVKCLVKVFKKNFTEAKKKNILLLVWKSCMDNVMITEEVWCYYIQKLESAFDGLLALGLTCRTFLSLLFFKISAQH